MFFRKAKKARKYATLESSRTGVRHIVVPTKKYICPPETYLGQDFIPGFTVVLFDNKQRRYEKMSTL